MTAIPSGNPRLFQQGKNVRGVLEGSSLSSQVIPLYDEIDGSAVVLAADEIFVLDTFEARAAVDTNVTLFFDNAGGGEGNIQSEWVSSPALLLGTSVFHRWSERSAPQSEVEGKPMIITSAEGTVGVFITGFIRKTIAKTLPIPP